MKLIIPILIFSILSAIAGYTLGRKHAPQHRTAETSTPVVETSEATTPPVEVELPVEPEPQAEPTPSTSPAPKVDHAARAKLPTQTLTDLQGRQLQAKILSVSDGQVSIRRTADGLDVTFPINLLCAEDAAFCTYLEAQKKPEPLKEGEIDWDMIFGS